MRIRLLSSLFCMALLLVGLFTLLIPQQSAAAGLADQISGQISASEKTAGVDGSADPREFVGNLIKIALSGVGIFFTSLIVMAGYWWATARGDESKVDKAQKTIRAAIIGLAIVLAAYAITNMVGQSAQEAVNDNTLRKSHMPQGATIEDFDEWSDYEREFN